MHTAEQLLIQLAGEQSGLVTRQQVLACGLSKHQLAVRLRSGFLVRAGARTYRLVGAPNDHATQLRALMLDIGGEVWASARTAAALAGLDGFEFAPPFDVAMSSASDIGSTPRRVSTPWIARGSVASVRPPWRAR